MLIKNYYIVMKYIFVTLAVISGLGKGVTTASMCAILKEMGYSIFSNTNKPSLGSTDRSSDMHRIYKIANIRKCSCN